MFQLGDEFRLSAGALAPVAGGTQQLQVVQVVGAAFGPRDDVVGLGIPVKWNSVSGDLEHGFRRSGTLVQLQPPRDFLLRYTLHQMQVPDFGPLNVTSVTVPPDWRELGEEDCDGLPDCASWIPLEADFMQDGATITGSARARSPRRRTMNGLSNPGRSPSMGRSA